MKFLKNTIAMVALFAIATINAKEMKPRGQYTTQSMITETSIDEFIDNVFNTKADELTNVLLDNYNEQQACALIENIAQTIANKFPMNATAKQLFISKMDIYLTEINDISRIDKSIKIKMQDCVNNKAMIISGTRTMHGRSSTTTPAKKTCKGGRCPYRK